MNLLTSFVGFYVLISQVVSQEGPTLIELTDDRESISWTPTSSETIEISADIGYQIQLDVTQFDVDGQSDDSVTVKAISEAEEEGNEIMLTYVVSGKPRYLYNNNKVQAEYVGTNTSNNVVMIKFTRVGELLTTTTIIPMTTLEPLPTPTNIEKSMLTVYLYGLPAALYGESEVKDLKEAIAKMGIEYCDIQNCPLNNTITWRNVQIEMLQQCSVMWEDYDTCAILTFALPIVKLEEQEPNPLWDGYQLNKSHLKLLWDAYGSKYLGQIGLSLYAVPDLNLIFKYRIIIISVVVVMLIIIVLTTRHLSGKIQKRRRRLSDTACIVDHTSDRISQQSLPPHYLQELPPHFAKSQYPNYSEYNMAFADDEEKSAGQSIRNQITISNDANDFEDAHA